MDNRQRLVFKAARSKARSEMTVLSRVLRKLKAEKKMATRPSQNVVSEPQTTASDPKY